MYRRAPLILKIKEIRGRCAEKSHFCPRYGVPGCLKNDSGEGGKTVLFHP